MESVIAAVALGSNLGDRRAHIAFALGALARVPDSKLIVSSKVVETTPVGPIEQGDYLNAAAVLETALAARDLLGHLLAIECVRGRDRAREQRWGPRTLDLDLLLYGDQTIDEPGLVVPHPRLHERPFVLGPLAEIGPDLVVPGLGKTIKALLKQASSATEGGLTD